tara:strand:- start:2258 stop:2461 length:204 start_codon:yes stop_codon:yes gene_type:complete
MDLFINNYFGRSNKMQERYHNYILRMLREERENELARDRQDNMEHDINVEWIRHFEKRSSKNNSQEI